MQDPQNTLVLVTGGTGFVGGHCILQLLQSGYRVRTTVRSLAGQDRVSVILRGAGLEPENRLTFAEADLLSDWNWPDAVRGCTYVLHVASPVPPPGAGDENDTIRPAVEGTLRVLRAARDAGVRRVVVTSSFVAIGFANKSRGEPFTEEDWTNPNSARLSPYVKSKTLAEKAAWDYVKREAPQLELATINPTAIFGPSLSPDTSSTFEILRGLLEGEIKGCPQIDVSLVDVRDVADLHLRAMTSPRAVGQRFLASSGEVVSLPDIARLLRKRLGADAGRVTTRVPPDWLVRVWGIFDPRIKAMTPLLGKRTDARNTKARELLGWAPRPAEDAILASVQSLRHFGLIGSRC